MKRKVFSGVLAVMMLMSLTACSGQANNSESTENGDEQGKYRIALLEKGAEDFFITTDKGFKDACEELNVDGTVVAPSTYHDPAEINNAMDQIINAKYDGVIISPQDVDANTSAVDAANAAGIPVICIDLTTTSENYVTSICTDNVGAGEKAADKMAELLGDAGGKVAIFANTPQAQSDMNRAKGFMERCAAEYPNIECLDIQFYENDINKCTTQVTDTLTANADLAAFFCVNDQTSLAAGNVLASSGKKDVVLVGFDADADEVALLSDGIIQALLVQRPYDMGYLGVQYMVDYLDGKEISKENVDPGCTVVTKENMNDPEIQEILNP